MSMDKKQAARQAGAKYSTNPIAAYVEYGKLTKQINSSFTFDNSNKKHQAVVGELKKEMLGLLKQYRHPINDVAERMIFFGHPDGPEIYSEGYLDPEFLVEMKKGNTPADLLEAVKKYVKEAELFKIELAACKDELKWYTEALEELIEIYKQNKNERSDKRNALVVQALGLSTGNAPKRLHEKRMYKDYFSFVRKKGMRRSEAVEKIVRQHGCTSNTAIKTLNNYRRHVSKRWEQEAPQNLSTVEKWLEGFVPSNR